MCYTDPLEDSSAQLVTFTNPGMKSKTRHRTVQSGHWLPAACSPHRVLSRIHSYQTWQLYRDSWRDRPSSCRCQYQSHAVRDCLYQPAVDIRLVTHDFLCNTNNAIYIFQWHVNPKLFTLLLHCISNKIWAVYVIGVKDFWGWGLEPAQTGWRRQEVKVGGVNYIWQRHTTTFCYVFVRELTWNWPLTDSLLEIWQKSRAKWWRWTENKVVNQVLRSKSVTLKSYYVS